MSKLHLLVIPSFYPDEFNPNLGSFFREQVKTLAEYGMKLNVIYAEQKSLRKISFKKLKDSYFQKIIIETPHWNEYRIKGWNIPGEFGKKIWIFLSEKLVEKYIEENGKPDLIHVHNVFWAGEVARNVNKKFHIPYVITEHSCSFLQKNLSDRLQKNAIKIYSKASKIIAVSNSLRSAINEIDPNLEIKIVPNIVDTDYFKPNKYGQHHKMVKFIAIGNLDKNKGHELLLEAFNSVSKINPNVNLSICGEGTEMKNLLEKIKFLKLESKVKLLGFLNKSEILERLQESDCLVHTSYFETFGVVLIEALACGIPIITTKSGGPEEIFKEGFGYIINAGSKRELTQAMNDFLSKKDTFIPQKLSSHIKENYSKEIIFKQLNEIFTEAIKGKD